MAIRSERVAAVAMLMAACWWSVASAGIAPNSGLEITARAHSNTIAPCLPVVVEFRVKNISSGTMHVMVPSVGSTDAVDSARTSVAVAIQDPSMKSTNILFGKPYIGPWREVYVKIRPAALAPSQELAVRLIVGGSWSAADERPIFTQEGRYSVALTYYPFVVADAAGQLRVDFARAIEIPVVMVTVLKRTEEDVAAWGEIEKLKHWWILYDPEMRNVKYLPDVEKQELQVTMEKLARDHGKSSYHKYLEYGAVAMRAARAKENGVVPSDAVDNLNRLANDQEFAYSSYAQDMLNRIK